MKLFFTVLCLLVLQVITAQPTNDQCISAIHIPSTEDFCSDIAQYTNVNASATPGLTNTCLTNFSSEVWFTFIPSTPAAIIQVFGAINNQGTLISPVVTVYDNCGSFDQVGCNSASMESNIAEVVVGDLIIGKVYLIAVDGQFGTQGSFTLCIDGFIPPPSPESDCDQAVVLCDKSPFFIESLVGAGNNTNEVDILSCIREEFASSWYKWTCQDAGTLSFTLTPNDYLQGFESDDLDFAVYELPNGINDCGTKRLLRCMASGANQNEPFSSWQICNGPTGLSESSSDQTEQPGCQAGNDNFVAAIDMEPGVSYALIVNNFSQSGLGFSIEFGGSGTFLGPEPAFEVDAVQAFECDKTIIFTDMSESQTDSIVSYIWNFGAGADPIFANTTGPHNVLYESFGDKKVALTVESSRGCIVTEILDIFVEPCCRDTSMLAVEATAQDQICPETSTGVIQAMGIAGNPQYAYSLDGVNFQPSPTFPGLDPGTYTVFVQDIKGCTNETMILVEPADEFSVDIGDTIFVDLGSTVQIESILVPDVLPSTVLWEVISDACPSDQGFLTFNSEMIVDQLRPIALPRGTTCFTITIISDAGCTATDKLVMLTSGESPIFIPNVISANRDNVNDHLMVFGGPAVEIVEFFRVYDRWGGLLYEATNFTPARDQSDIQFGWDGTIANSNEFVQPGVYTYAAKVNFVDCVSRTFTGTVTVLR